MKWRNKIGVILLSICLLLPMFSMMSHAASGSVSVSSKSGNVGSTVTITCTIKCTSGPIGTADVVLVYDQASLQYVSGSGGYSLTGGSGSVVYSGLTADGTSSSLSFTVKFKILKAGSHKVSVSSANAYDIDEVQFAPSKGSGTITGKAPTTVKPSNPGNDGNDNKPQNNKDTNSKLSSLQVYPGSLSPNFNADTSSYTVTVPADTTQVTISATPQSNKATVSVSGGKDLKLGANEAKVIVVAESGASRAYTLTIMCGEKEKIQIGGVEYTINESFTDEQIPTGFSRKQVAYNNRQYEAVANASGNLLLMNLQSAEKTEFFIYDEKAQAFQDFAQITLSEGKYIIPLPLSEEMSEFAGNETVAMQVQNKNFEAWKLDDEFCVAYVMNQDGKTALYRYDSVDKTFQRYVEIPVEEVVEEEQKPVEKTIFPNEYYMYAIVGLGVFAVILLIAMIYFIASRKARHEGRKRKVAKRQEKQRAKEERELEKQRAKEEKKLAKQKKKEK